MHLFNKIIENRCIYFFCRHFVCKDTKTLAKSLPKQFLVNLNKKS